MSISALQLIKPIDVMLLSLAITVPNDGKPDMINEAISLSSTFRFVRFSTPTKFRLVSLF